MPDHLPASVQKIEPARVWSDLELAADSVTQLRAICHLMRNSPDVQDERDSGAMSRSIGTAVLFSGPSGPGKTMAAEVLARELNRNLYRVDSSGVISKYIGETEKNLDLVFQTAADSGAILLFDEADALFGKRSDVRDSHDRYANPEAKYVGEQMEKHCGLIILAANSRHALDLAFLSRIAYTVNFPMPA